MKKILLGIAIFLLVVSVGYCQKLDNSIVQKECEDLVLWFQQEFNTTANYETSKGLMQSFDTRLNELIKKYGQKDVIEIISSIAKNDKRLNRAATVIILGRLDRLVSKENSVSLLQLTIKSDKQVYEVGEYIKMEIYLSNLEQEVVSRIMNGDGYYKFIKDGTLEGKIKLRPISMYGHKIGNTIPTSDMRDIWPFTPDSSLKEFSPGIYEISVISKDWISNTLQIEVVEKREY